MKAFNACLAAALLLGSSAVSAGAYKCTDANGRVSYQQQPCPQQAKGERVKLGVEWTLIDDSDSGYYGSTKTYFDPEHIATVDGFKRVAFKRNYTTGSSGKVYPDEQYYHFFDCATGKMSIRVNERDARPGALDTRYGGWEPWQERTGPYPNIRVVFEAACPK